MYAYYLFFLAFCIIDESLYENLNIKKVPVPVSPFGEKPAPVRKSESVKYTSIKFDKKKPAAAGRDKEVKQQEVKARHSFKRSPSQRLAAESKEKRSSVDRITVRLYTVPHKNR